MKNIDHVILSDCGFTYTRANSQDITAGSGSSGPVFLCRGIGFRFGSFAHSLSILPAVKNSEMFQKLSLSKVLLCPTRDNRHLQAIKKAAMIPCGGGPVQ